MRSRLSSALALAFLALLGTAASVTAQGGPVHHWPGDGNAYDVVGAIDGTPVGDVQYVTGVSGLAFSFAGAGYLDLTSQIGNFGTGDFSIALWLKTPTTGGSHQPLFVKRRGTNTGILNLLLQPGGNLVLEMRDDDANAVCCGYAFVGTTNLADGQWHHVALTRQGPSTALFVDGAPAAGTPYDPGQTVALSSPGYSAETFAVGASLPYHLYYGGQLDELAIWDRALTPAEVQDLFQPSTPNQPPVVLQAAPSVATIWPPNNKLVSISVLGVFDPDGDPISIQITGITNNETGSADAAGLGSATALVRAARNGKGTGRTYTIAFVATDGQGGSTPGSVTVTVPHDQRK